MRKQAEKTSGKNKRKKQAEKNKRKKTSGKTSENKEKIISYFRKNGNASPSELADSLKFSNARIRALLSALTNDGTLVPFGNGRSRRYTIKEIPAHS